MQNIENKMNNENVNKPTDPKELEKLKKKEQLTECFKTMLFDIKILLIAYLL